jgi:hypothetical protein
MFSHTVHTPVPCTPRLAFFPPQPATYDVEEHKDSTRELYIKPRLR